MEDSSVRNGARQEVEPLQSVLIVAIAILTVVARAHGAWVLVWIWHHHWWRLLRLWLIAVAVTITVASSIGAVVTAIAIIGRIEDHWNVANHAHLTVRVGLARLLECWRLSW